MLRKIYILIGLIVLMALAGLGWYFLAVNSKTKVNEAKSFVVEKGQGVNEISSNLYEEKLIKSKLAFETYLYLKELEGSIKAGDYKFSKDVSIKELVKVLITGVVMDEDQITTLEGWNNKEVADYLEKKGLVEAKTFIEKANCGCGVKVAEFDFLKSKPDQASLEGFLFPDTYRLFKDATAVDIINKMLQNFDNKLTDKMREDIEAQGKNVFEIVTMASIIEKEARGESDKRKVSDIFWKRIRAGMGLESCATINYITGKDDPAASLADLEIDSPYNTYKYKGLPPGPICNPGLDSIVAAIYPESTPYWYFLNGTDGTTHFAKTFEEHKQNKWKYLK